MKEQNQVDNDEANNNKQQRQHSLMDTAFTAPKVTNGHPEA